MTSIVTPTNAFRTHSMTRRQVLSTGTSAGAALAASACADVGAAPTQAESGGSDRPAVSFTLNGARVECAEDARRTLLDQLREAEGLTGTKVGCRHGQCGACTVHIEGDPHLACLTLLARLEGRAVTTIEGLADAAAGEGIATQDGLHPVQAAFIERDAFQCGYCTPGQIMSAVAVIAEGHTGSDEQIREYMSGNLCRCAAYPHILEAVREASGRMPGGTRDVEGSTEGAGEAEHFRRIARARSEGAHKEGANP